MNRVDVKAMVQQAVGGEWDAFCRRHPALSRAVDQDLIVEQYAQDLKSTPEFVEALRAVEMDGLAHAAIQDLVVTLVRGWIRVL